MTRSKVKVKVTRPLKLEILQFSKSISSGIFNVSWRWQMTTDSETTEQYLNFVWTRFLISVLVFVSRDYKPQSRTGLIFQFTNAFGIAITFSRWQRRSEESTAVPYGANFYLLCPWSAAVFASSCHVCCNIVHTYLLTHCSVLLTVFLVMFCFSLPTILCYVYNASDTDFKDRSS